MSELAGRTAIVTGAGRNIGRAIALALAEAGASVVLNGRSDGAALDSVVSEVQSKGGKARAILADVGNEAAVNDMVAAAATAFGRIDIIVNNAAGRPETRFETMTFADWRGVQSTVLDGAFLIAKAALPHLKQSGAGAIVNIGGVGTHVGAKNRAHVIAAKAGLIGLTRALAHELAAYNVTVNCVAPGLIATARDPNAPMPQHHQVSRTLAGRLGEPEEVAAAVRFLAGPQGRYITGQTLHVSGGMFLT
jgi:3-oxoacyl-[acyl-carrier protein] reductase